jgi:hypothetical protein
MSDLLLTGPPAASRQKLNTSRSHPQLRLSLVLVILTHEANFGIQNLTLLHVHLLTLDKQLSAMAYLGRILGLEVQSFVST